MQGFYIGRHLKTCSCATDEGREFVSEIARSMNYQEHKQPSTHPDNEVSEVQP